MNRISVSLLLFFIIMAALVGCDNTVTEPGEGVHGNNLFVMNGLGETVSRIDLDRYTTTIQFVTTQGIPGDIAVTGDHLLVLNSVPAALEVFSITDSTKVTTVNLPPGSNPIDMLVTDERIYATGFVSDMVYVLDAENYALLDSVQVGKDPDGLAVDETHLYVACTGGWQTNYARSAVYTIDQSSLSVTDSILTSTNPHQMAWAPNGMLHVVCTGNYFDIFGTVNIIDPASLRITDTLEVGGFPGSLTIAPDQTAYLPDFGESTASDSAGYIYTYNTSTLSIEHGSDNPVKVGFGAMGVLYDEREEQLYVTSARENTVQVLDPHSYELLLTYFVGGGPEDMVLWRESD